MKVQNTVVLALTAIACAPGHVLAEQGQTTARRLKATKPPSEKVTKPPKAASEKVTKSPSMKMTKAPSEKVTKSPSMKVKVSKSPKTTKSPSEKGTKAPKATKSPKPEGATKAPGKSKKEKLPKLEACLSTFEGAAGTYPDVKGKVKMYFDGTMITVKASLEDAVPNCETCGIHIHEGASCESVASQSVSIENPWVTSGVAIYTSNYKGKGKADFMINAGTTYEDNIGKVVIVHDKDGDRYACGVLSTEKAKGCKK